jgi:hypothetical protein
METTNKPEMEKKPKSLSEIAHRIEALEKDRDDIIDNHSKNDKEVCVEFLIKEGDYNTSDVDIEDSQYRVINVTDFKQHFCHVLIDLINKRIEVLKKEMQEILYPTRLENGKH